MSCEFRAASRLKIALLLVLLCLGLASAKEKLVVAVSLAPYATMLKSIAGDYIDIVTMIPPGADPHTYEPKPDVLKAFSKASVYFTDGSGMDKAWLPRFKGVNKRVETVDVTDGIEWILQDAHGKDVQGKDSKDAHAHEKLTLDPHLWTSPKQALKVMSNMRSALSKYDPDNNNVYVMRFSRMIQTLEKVGKDVARAVYSLPKEARTFIVFHPSFGYLARDYGLKQLTIEVNGKEPKPKDLKKLVQEGKKNNVRLVFVQPQFSKRSAETIATELVASVVTVNPLDADYLESTRTLIKAISAAASKLNSETKATKK